jgi:hypothetical protein
VVGLRALASYAARRRDEGGGARACDVCAAPLREPHRHVLERAPRVLRCACEACAVLFAAGDRYRTVPARVLLDPSFHPTPAQWAALRVPVGLAYVVRCDERSIVYFPSPAGAVEGELDDAAWAAVAAASRLAALAEPEVEALVLSARRGRESLCALAPIDACAQLVAVVRRRWHGLTGGDGVDAGIDDWLAGLRARAETVR